MFGRQRPVDALSDIAVERRLDREQGSYMQLAAHPSSVSVVRRERARWFVIPVPAQCRGDCRAGRLRVGVRRHVQDCFVGEHLAHSASLPGAAVLRVPPTQGRPAVRHVRLSAGLLTTRMAAPRSSGPPSDTCGCLPADGSMGAGPDTGEDPSGLSTSAVDGGAFPASAGTGQLAEAGVLEECDVPVLIGWGVVQ